MALAASNLTKSPAYRTGAWVLFLAAATIFAALAFEHLGGYIACPLCLQQRYAYYAGIPLLFLALVLVSAERGSLAASIFLLVSFAFLANAGLGVYHAGVEWGLWPGPQSCEAAQSISGSAGALLDDLATARVVRCDRAPWQFGGLSFAGWNVVVSLVLFAGALRAAFLARFES